MIHQDLGDLKNKLSYFFLIYNFFFGTSSSVATLLRFNCRSVELLPPLRCLSKVVGKILISANRPEPNRPGATLT